MNTLVVIVGPTGVGKTETAIRVAEHLSTTVINADSRQIFAELPIGTAAPTREQQARVKHYFVGNHHIADYYSAAMYEHDVLSLLDSLFPNSPVQLLAGGSMLYIDAVCKGIDDIPTIDDATRTTMKRRLATEGLNALVDELRKLDPDYWQTVDRHNTRRVVHALEICHMTGKTYTSFRRRETRPRPFDIIKVGLARPREETYDRINRRVLQMMDDGLQDEARRVYPLRGLNALNTVGYRELFDHFDGTIPLDEAIRRIQSNTRQYMRKQLTWFKRDTDICWFSPDDTRGIIDYVDGRLHDPRRTHAARKPSLHTSS